MVYAKRPRTLWEPQVAHEAGAWVRLGAGRSEGGLGQEAKGATGRSEQKAVEGLKTARTILYSCFVNPNSMHSY